MRAACLVWGAASVTTMGLQSANRRDPRHDILFEPVAIGPVTAKNRFYQVPHCNGSGYQYPRTAAAMRGIKAEGGWAVVNTEWCSIHPSADTAATGCSRLWSDSDIRQNQLVTDAIHAHGALAGCELSHAGLTSHNLYSRLPTLGPSVRPKAARDFPGNARAITLSEMADIRRWHRIAVRRAIAAGFDIVTLYASHGITIFTDFLSREINLRTDAYGGSIENRVRFLRETLEEVIDEAAGRIAIGLRFGLKPGAEGADDDGRAVIEMLAEMPDLWDVNVGDGSDMLTSRFRSEGWQEPIVGFVKTMTSKPVVGVGRFTSPDTMASMVRRGVLDLIGAARPSIADPFLPAKVDAGRSEDIRECIGCNICLASNQLGVPIRCTQNPTMSEEWRRGWHPERMPVAGSKESVLIVGAGPAGLEAARAAGQRGYNVTLAEATRALGGHLNQVTRLPGLAEWRRVRDWRVGQIEKMPNVAVYRESRLTAADVLGFDFAHVFLATGARWRRDGVGLTNFAAIPGVAGRTVLTPDDILAGAELRSPVVIFDDDSYVVGGAIAEMVARQGHQVTLVTPAPLPSGWTQFTYDIAAVQRRIVEAGVTILPNCNLARIEPDQVELVGCYGGALFKLEAAGLVLVTMRDAEDELQRDLMALISDLPVEEAPRITAIGDCAMPGLLAEAVFSGHVAARALDNEEDMDQPFRIEQADVTSDLPLPPHLRELP